ncbi:MAG: anthranilate synthase component I family protein [Sandaracinaceae bacterium]
MAVIPDRETFLSLAAGGATVVPVTREILADALTPVTAYATLGHVGFGARALGSYLLESVEHGEKWGRYSFVGWRPDALIRGRAGRVEVEDPRGRIEALDVGDPWPVLRARLAEWVPPPAGAFPLLPRFWGGAVGYVSYDAVRTFEPTIGREKADPEAWDFAFSLGGASLIFDDLRQRIYAVSARRITEEPGRAYDDALRELDAVADELSRPRVPRLLEPPPKRTAAERARDELPASSFDRASYREVVATAKEHIRAGDIFQVVPSQRFEVDARGVELFDVYRMLRVINPSPYMYFLRFGDRAIAGASPETLVRLEDGRAELRPIAGTRPRGKDDADDQRIADELLADPKERAEHVMLVDLGRNDLGRIAAPGTVRITEKMSVERYSHVMHLVSNVTCDVEQGRDALDVLRATFPAGTLSGAPKVRAMQIIEAVEPVARGLYGGAVGYVSFDGNMDFAIAIRTLVEEGGKVRVQAGGGVVEASDADAEYDETVNKARAALDAIHAVRRFGG